MFCEAGWGDVAGEFIFKVDHSGATAVRDGLPAGGVEVEALSDA
jgi:hypothetical protein